MHKVWFARGVSGVDFQGMEDHGQLGANVSVNNKGERSFVSWCLSGQTFLLLFKAVDSSAKHSLPHKRYIEIFQTNTHSGTIAIAQEFTSACLYLNMAGKDGLGNR